MDAAAQTKADKEAHKALIDEGIKTAQAAHEAAGDAADLSTTSPAEVHLRTADDALLHRFLARGLQLNASLAAPLSASPPDAAGCARQVAAQARGGHATAQLLVAVRSPLHSRAWLRSPPSRGVSSSQLSWPESESRPWTQSRNL